MALSVALPLSGLESESFSTFGAFGLRDILGLSQASPSPSISSDSSSIGSLGSLKSDSVNNVSIPSSPQNIQKKNVLSPMSNATQVSTPSVTPQKTVTCNPSPVRRGPVVKPDPCVMYGGRNILNLGANISSQGWDTRYAYLPPNNTSVFFANRSQYHRLGGYNIDHPSESCQECGFTYIPE